MCGDVMLDWRYQNSRPDFTALFENLASYAHDIFLVYHRQSCLAQYVSIEHHS
jgi:hypothetical protein